jgi:hypothetical protein
VRLKEVERRTLSPHEMHFKEDKIDKIRLEIWGRLANLQLQHHNEFQIGVWIHRDAHFSSLFDDLQSTVEDTMLALPTTLTVASLDWEYKHEVLEADEVFDEFKDTGFVVVKDMATEARLVEWGVKTFQELFIYKDESTEISGVESSEEPLDDGIENGLNEEGGKMDVDED